MLKLELSTQSLLSLSSENYFRASPPINLLPRPSLKKSIPAFIAVSLFFLLCFAGFLGLQQWQFYQANHQLDQAIHELYFQLFPNATTLTDPKTRIKQALSQLQQQQQEDLFLQQLDAFARIHKNFALCKVQALTYENGILSLTLLSKDPDTINQLIATLKKNYPGKVELIASDGKDKAMQGTILMEAL